MPNFGPRGSELWLALAQSSEFSPSGVLAVEACRAADRLDDLDRLMAEGDLSVLVEARLQAAGLKSLLESPLLKPSEDKGASGVDSLAAKRAARRAAAQGS